MTPHRSTGAALAVLLATSLAALPAAARTMTVMDSHPSASAVMTGAAEEFFIRFDGPVDHAASALSILRDARVVATLRARLESQPNTLYATAGHLPPGGYVLHWRTVSMVDRDASEGDIPFSVR